MTSRTNRNDIQQMFWAISFVMMVLFRLRTAVFTLQGIRTRQFAEFDGISNNILCFLQFRMNKKINFSCFLTSFALIIMFLYNFTFCTQSITFLFFLAFFALEVTFLCRFEFLRILSSPLTFFHTKFALVMMSIFPYLIFMKFRDRFNLFASATSFSYDSLRHGFLLIRKSCLGPVAGQAPAVGSLYNNIQRELFNNKKLNYLVR